MDVKTIELYEDNRRNWRHSYHVTLCAQTKALRQERESYKRNKRIWKKSDGRIYLDQDYYDIGEMDDQELEYVARRLTERAVERAIIERNEALKIERKRLSQAQ